MRAFLFAAAAAVSLIATTAPAQAQYAVGPPAVGVGVYAAPTYNPYAGIGVNLGPLQVGVGGGYPYYGAGYAPYRVAYPYGNYYRGYGYNGYGNRYYRGGYNGGYRGR